MFAFVGGPVTNVNSNKLILADQETFSRPVSDI